MMSEYRVYPLPEGTHEGATIVRGSRSSQPTLVKLANGVVYTLQHRSMDMATEYESNDATRRVFSKLSGVPFAEIKKAHKKAKAESIARDKERRLESAKRYAASNGYKLVKVTK